MKIQTLVYMMAVFALGSIPLLNAANQPAGTVLNGMSNSVLQSNVGLIPTYSGYNVSISLSNSSYSSKMAVVLQQAASMINNNAAGVYNDSYNGYQNYYVQSSSGYSISFSGGYDGSYYSALVYTPNWNYVGEVYFTEVQPSYQNSQIAGVLDSMKQQVENYAVGLTPNASVSVYVANGYTVDTSIILNQAASVLNGDVSLGTAKNESGSGYQYISISLSNGAEVYYLSNGSYESAYIYKGGNYIGDVYYN
jgi:hypothetical protein